jgi:ABC-type polysaccharide/polyol phosphate export permease
MKKRVRLIQLFSEIKIVGGLTARNIKIKYKNTWLGFIWMLLQPICTIAILYFVFSRVIRLDIDNFPFFLCAGVLPWTFFASALTEATSSILVNSNLVLKVNFQREILPLTYCLSNLFDFVVSLCVLLIIYACIGIFVSPLAFFYLILVIFLHFLFVYGFSMFLSILHIFYKDIGHLLSIVLMFWFYLTPIFYAREQVPVSFQTWYEVNPMTHFITAYRTLLFSGGLPAGATIFKISFFALGTFCLGYAYFVSQEKNVAKEL